MPAPSRPSSPSPSYSHASWRRRTAPRTAAQARHRRAYALIEALGALSIVLAGLLPMAIVGTTGLGWLRQLERLARSTRTAAEAAELGQCALAPIGNLASAIMPTADAAGCLPADAPWGRP